MLRGTDRPWPISRAAMRRVRQKTTLLFMMFEVTSNLLNGHALFNLR